MIRPFTRLLHALMLIETLVQKSGLVAALVLLPCLILVRVTEIVTRNLNTAGSLYNALESELFLLFAFLTIAAAYVNDAHVRVDLFRDRYSPRGRAFVELLGGLFFVLPFCLIVLWYGGRLTVISFEDGERSAIALGQQWRWLIIASLPIGTGLFGLAVVSKMVRCVLFLFGRTPDPFAHAAANLQDPVQ